MILKVTDENGGVPFKKCLSSGLSNSRKMRMNEANIRGKLKWVRGTVEIL